MEEALDVIPLLLYRKVLWRQQSSHCFLVAFFSSHVTVSEFSVFL